jgi:hypothetical protein
MLQAQVELEAQQFRSLAVTPRCPANVEEEGVQTGGAAWNRELGDFEATKEERADEQRPRPGRATEPQGHPQRQEEDEVPQGIGQEALIAEHAQHVICGARPFCGRGQRDGEDHHDGKAQEAPHRGPLGPLGAYLCTASLHGL